MIKWVLILVILTNFSVIQSIDADYILNGKFTDNNCLISANDPTCTVQTIGNRWMVRQYYDFEVTAKATLVNAKWLNPSSPDQNAALLNTFNDQTGVNQNICISYLLTLSPGQFTLSFYTIVGQQSPLPISQFVLARVSSLYGILTKKQSVDIFLTTVKLDSKGQKYFSYSVSYTGKQDTFLVSFCGLKASNIGAFLGIRDVKLIAKGNTCDQTTPSRPGTLSNRNIVCIPLHTWFFYECLTFEQTPGKQFSHQCVTCSPTSTRKYLIELFDGTKTCSEERGPGVKNYKVKQIGFSKFYFVPNQCVGVKSSTAYTLAPSLSAYMNGLQYTTDVDYCGTDSPGVNLWDIVGEQYVAVGCLDASHQFAFTDSIPPATFCVDKTASYYVPKCTTYKLLDPNNYKCTKCSNSYKLVNLKLGNTISQICIQESDLRPYCTEYIEDQTYNDYYCTESGCSDGSQPIVITSDGFHTCTKLDVFPIGVLGQCKTYSNGPLYYAANFLECKRCLDNLLQPPLCKAQNDICDNNPSLDTFGIQVNVNGDDQKCAQSGFISYCAVYAEITDLKILVGCKTCSPNYFIVDGSKGFKICVLKLISNCLIYLSDGSCEQTLVPQTLPTNNNTITNCQTLEKIDNAEICVACKIGYVKNLITNGCIKHVMFCSNYSKFGDGICQNCVKGYFLNNNQCLQKSLQCIKEDYSGNCLECLPGFRSLNGLCEKIPMNQICKEGQYRNYHGNCAEGTVQNCQSYIPLTGECAECKFGFQFNFKFECRPSQILCPSSNSTTKYFVQFTSCVSTDLHCQLSLPDGYCSNCDNGFYAFKGKCLQISNFGEN